MDYSLYHGSLTLAVSDNGSIFREGRWSIQNFPGWEGVTVIIDFLWLSTPRGNGATFYLSKFSGKLREKKKNEQREGLPLRTLNQMDCANIDQWRIQKFPDGRVPTPDFGEPIIWLNF